MCFFLKSNAKELWFNSYQMFCNMIQTRIKANLIDPLQYHNESLNYTDYCVLQKSAKPIRKKLKDTCWARYNSC